METISHSSSSPLFSTIVTFYTLILLYLPQLFLKLLLSPLLISTLVLLLYLLRLGASQQQLSINPAKGAHAPRLVITQNDLEPGHEPEPEPKPESNEVESVETDVRLEGEVAKPQCIMAEAHSATKPDPRPEPETCDSGQPVDVDTFATYHQEKEKEKEKESFPTLDWAKLEPAIGPKLFLEWDVGAPLEVIYEVYEGEEEAGDEAQNEAFRRAGMIKRYPSLSRYYPESDSDSNSDSSSSSLSLDEEEEEEREGLIEIALDSYAYKGDNKRVVNMIMKPKLVAYQKEVDRHSDDEDNLIEIDISPTKNMSAFSW